MNLEQYMGLNSLNKGGRIIDWSANINARMRVKFSLPG